MILLKEVNEIITLINVFTVDKENQYKLVEMLKKANEQIYNKQEGFISAIIHKSLDGTKIINYLQWKNRNDIEKMLKNTKVILHMNDVLNISKLDGSLYEIVSTYDKT